MTIERLVGARYVVPLREGGSLPAVVETDRDGAVRRQVSRRGPGREGAGRRGAGGRAGARRSDLPVPRAGHRRAGRGLRQRRAGPGDPGHPARQRRRRTSGWPTCRARWPSIRPWTTTSRPTWPPSIVWLDAYITNVDRTARNTNMLLWREPALADRPRRGAVRPPPLGGLAGAHPVAVPADQRPRAAAASPATSKRPTPGCARG